MPSDDDGAPRVPQGRSPNTLGPVGWYVIENLKQLREARRLSYRELAAKLEELGRPIPALGLSRIEKGNRRVDTDDLIALALALGVNPSALFLPRGEPGSPTVPADVIELTSGLQARLADAWEWADGQIPLPRPDEETGPQAVDFESHARPTWLHRGILRASEIPARIKHLEDQMQQLKFLASAPSIAEHLAGQPIPVEEQVEQPVVAAIVTSDLGVLVGRRNDGTPPWTFIAGEVEPGESPADAAIREVKEETTLRVRAGEVIGERVHPKTGRTMIYMAAQPTHGTEIFVGDEDELAEVRWVSLAEALDLMQPYGMFEPVHEHLARELAEG